MLMMISSFVLICCPNNTRWCFSNCLPLNAEFSSMESKQQCEDPYNLAIGLGPSAPDPSIDTSDSDRNSCVSESHEFIDTFTPIDEVYSSTSGKVKEENVTFGICEELSNQAYLLMKQEQALSQQRAQKQRHVRGLSLKKDKLQQLLVKLDSSNGYLDCNPKRLFSREMYLGVSGEEDGGELGPGERQRAASERTNTTDSGDRFPLKGHISRLVEDKYDRTIHRLRETMHTCWRRIFQVVSFPLILAFTFVIEFLLMISHYIIKVMTVGLVVVLGEQVILPLVRALGGHLIQPLASLLLSLTTAVRNILLPLLNIFRDLFQHTALLVRSFRLVDVTVVTVQPKDRQDV